VSKKLNLLAYIGRTSDNQGSKRIEGELKKRKIWKNTFNAVQNWISFASIRA
jgi:hypothetical protein